MSESYTGRITTMEFSDGEPIKCADCGGDCCECCEDANRAKPEGTYLTIRLDTNPSVQFGRVVVTYEETTDV